MVCDVCGGAGEGGLGLSLYAPTGDRLCSRCLCLRCGLPLRRFGLSLKDGSAADAIVTCNCSHTLARQGSAAASAEASPQKVRRRGRGESGGGGGRAREERQTDWG